jgi:uncharacterized protein (TIGR02246 family)
MRKSDFGSACLVVALSLCGGTVGVAQTVEYEIKAAGLAWEEAYNNGDVDGVTAMHAEDAVVMPPGFADVVGEDAIRADAEAFFSEFATDHATDKQEIIVEGDIAIERADYTDMLTPKAGGDPIADAGKHIVAYRRGDDGDWKILWAIWNPTPAE